MGDRVHSFNCIYYNNGRMITIAIQKNKTKKAVCRKCDVKINYLEFVFAILKGRGRKEKRYFCLDCGYKLTRYHFIRWI